MKRRRASRNVTGHKAEMSFNEIITIIILAVLMIVLLAVWFPQILTKGRALVATVIPSLGVKEQAGPACVAVITPGKAAICNAVGADNVVIRVGTDSLDGLTLLLQQAPTIREISKEQPLIIRFDQGVKDLPDAQEPPNLRVTKTTFPLKIGGAMMEQWLKNEFVVCLADPLSSQVNRRYVRQAGTTIEFLTQFGTAGITAMPELKESNLVGEEGWKESAPQQMPASDAASLIDVLASGSSTTAAAFTKYAIMDVPGKPRSMWFHTARGEQTGPYDFDAWNTFGSQVYDSAKTGTEQSPGGCIAIDNGRAVALSRLPGAGFYIITFRNPTVYSKDSKQVLPINRDLSTIAFRYEPS